MRKRRRASDAGTELAVRLAGPLATGTLYCARGALLRGIVE
jgi:hypothetical protein